MEIAEYEEPKQLKSEQAVAQKPINILSCCTDLQPCKSWIMIGYITLSLVTECDVLSMIFMLAVLYFCSFKVAKAWHKQLTSIYCWD